VTQTDIQRLQDAVDEAGRDVSRMRSRDAQQAERLQDELDELRDEVVYLKVKLRRERNVPRSDYADLRDRIDALRNRAQGSSTSESVGSSTRGSTPLPPASDRDRDASSTTSRRPAATSGRSAIPVGQELDVRLQDQLSSDNSQVEDRFIATTMVDLQVDERVLIPAGSELRGVVSSVSPAGRMDRTGKMTVTFDQIEVNGRTYAMRGTVTEALQSEGIRGEAAKIGTGAGVGAIIGGILGGFKGALAGILIGGGGVIAATEGKDVELPAGTVLRVRLDSPPEIR
jgi:hypothetical protein